MGLEKARIVYEVENKDDKKAKTDAKDKKTLKRIDVMFNPSSLKIRSATKYSDPKPINTRGKELKALQLEQFLRVENDVLTVELFFDTTREGINARDVRVVVLPILALAKAPKGGKLPPKLVFAWGGFSFPCVISSIDQTYDYFDSSGRALRATLAITLIGCDPSPKKDEKPAAAVKSGKKETKIKDGEKPPEAAARTNGDPKEWRPVCEAEGEDNPLKKTAKE